MDLTNQNKNYQEQVGSVIHEQEKSGLDQRHCREKKTEHLKENVESLAILQKIFDLSEDSYFERVVGKREFSSLNLLK